jgi:hypothetical protein
VNLPEPVSAGVSGRVGRDAGAVGGPAGCGRVVTWGGPGLAGGRELRGGAAGRARGPGRDAGVPPAAGQGPGAAARAGGGGRDLALRGGFRGGAR